METLLIFAVLLVRLSPALSLFGEKKEIPRSFSYSIYRNGDGNVESVRGDSNRFSERQGTPPGLNVALGPAAPSVGNYGGPPYPPYGFKDPGFSVQTGFEGFLVRRCFILSSLLSNNFNPNLMGFIPRFLTPGMLPYLGESRALFWLPLGLSSYWHSRQGSFFSY